MKLAGSVSSRVSLTHSSMLPEHPACTGYFAASRSPILAQMGRSLDKVLQNPQQTNTDIGTTASEAKLGGSGSELQKAQEALMAALDGDSSNLV